MIRILINIGFILAFFCALLVAWFVFFSNVFVIEYVDIESARIDATFARALVFNYMDENQGAFNQRNIFFLRSMQLRNYIARYAIIDDFSLKKIFPNRIRILVNGSPFRVIGYSQGHFFEISPNGTRGRDVDTPALARYSRAIKDKESGERVIVSKDILKKMDMTFPLILFGASDNPSSTSPILTAESTISHIEETKKRLANEKYAIIFFTVEPEDGQYRAFTNEGWYMLFSSRSEPGMQAENVKTLLLASIKKKRKMLDYIDARFENRLFYTLRK